MKYTLIYQCTEFEIMKQDYPPEDHYFVCKADDEYESTNFGCYEVRFMMDEDMSDWTATCESEEIAYKLAQLLNEE